MSKVSIIMPIYNAQEYLREAIESVLNQTYTDYELILINDRSTDSSKEICREYSKKDNRIVILDNNSENHGPGPTRNIGLDYARGEYIYFMDADDWVDRKLLQYAVKRMQETNADIVQFGVIYENNENNSEEYCWKGKDLLTKNEIRKDFLNFQKENRHSLWMHLFRQKTVETIRFENIINGEDVSYVMDALSNAEKIAYIAKPLYHYRYVVNSISHSWVDNMIECREIIWNHQKNYLDSFQGYIDNLVYAEAAYYNYIWVIYQLCLDSCIMPYIEKKRELFRIKETMEFDKYRNLYPLKLQHGMQKIKYALVKYHLERMLLLWGPIFLKVVKR